LIFSLFADYWLTPLRALLIAPAARYAMPAVARCHAASASQPRSSDDAASAPTGYDTQASAPCRASVCFASEARRAAPPRLLMLRATRFRQPTCFIKRCAMLLFFHLHYFLFFAAFVPAHATDDG
jgi:hypothetical protein